MLSRIFAPSALIVALLFPAIACAQAKGYPDPQYELKGAALTNALKGGGYTLLFRHAAREPNVTEAVDKIVMSDCSTQIPLGAHGRAQAQSAGEAMRELGIPLGESIASPYCRTMETARLIAGHARADNALLSLTSDNVPESKPFARLIEIVATPPEPGTNRVIVGHTSASTSIEGGPYLQEGESAIFKVIDRRRVLVARMRIEDWHAYAFPANKPPPAQRSSLPDKLLQHRGFPLATTIRFGGYTIYFRNAATDPQENKPVIGAAADCSTQRNLSASGREQARAIGVAFATMHMPLGEVVATTSCSAVETARLVSRTDAITSIAYAKPAPDDSPLGRLLATPAPPYKVRVVIGDADEFNALAGPPALAEGEAVVMRATDAGGWVILSRLPAAEWVGMPAAAGFPPLVEKK